ncbi:MAG: DUF2878 domain-containing protein [Gammaproteobacteria bacterium HGW-Gammaproteobacteria-14]|nr:MAG: DUF2878 domain-containing protein [Gammaproteobacteria bacterium HGW-Gammaproteobacteria-14]
MKKDMAKASIIGNFVIFQLLWLAAVLGAAEGFQWLGLGALVVLLAWSWFCRADMAADRRIIGYGLTLGIAFELLLIGSGLIRYELQWWAAMPPIWILCLWAGFAQTLNHSLAWLKNRLSLAAVFGAVGSVMSMYAGIRFGAAQAPEGLQPLLVVYALGWSMMVPALVWLAGRSTSPATEAA